MAKLGSIDISGMEDFEKKLREIHDSAAFDAFCRAAARELAARLLAKVIKRTPVGQYPQGSGKVGGTLRRGWTAGEDKNAALFAASLPVEKEGNTYIITVSNAVEYAPYVEFGHRTRNHKGWVEGKFMLTKSENELKKIAPQVLEKRLERFLKEALS